jgi:tetratricopeptide (TPR) repeat protein
MSSKKKRIKIQETSKPEELSNKEISLTKNKEKNLILFVYSGLIIFIFLLVVLPDSKFDDPWNTATVEFQDAIKLTDKQKQSEIFKNSIDVLIKQIHIHPYHARLYSMLGYMYLITGNWDSCISNQSMAIKLGSGGLVNQIEFKAAEIIINATVNKAKKLLKMKDTLGCMNTFRHSLSIIPQNQKLLKFTGGFFSDFRQPDSSLKYLYASAQYNNKDPEVMYLLGYSYYLKNNPDSAKIYLSGAIAINSNYTQAKNLLNKLISK